MKKRRNIRRRRRKDKWLEYERRKKVIQKMGISPEQYENKLRLIAEQLKV